MFETCTVEFIPGTREELLPNFDSEFPHIITRAAFREGDSAPWHWHQAVELFYIDSGTLEYITPSGSHVFHSGSGGFVNSNVLHTTRGHQVQPQHGHSIHLFDPALISGAPGSRMEKTYVMPLTTALQVELIALSPEDPEQAQILELLRQSFALSPEEMGYELRMRSALSEIWLRLLKAAEPQLCREVRITDSSSQIKRMLLYIHEHYSEKITVKAVAGAAYVSERTCYDLFHRNLRTTPMEYINSYRLRSACRLLAQTEDSVTAISAACGMNNSYFCQLFRETTGFTPLEYRRICQRHQSSRNAPEKWER